jgi:hypothetical protein
VPPKLLSVKPESGSVNVRPNEVNFQFDEVLNEQVGGGDLNKQVIISPPRARAAARHVQERVGSTDGASTTGSCCDGVAHAFAARPLDANNSTYR